MLPDCQLAQTITPAIVLAPTAVSMNHRAGIARERLVSDAITGTATFIRVPEIWEIQKSGYF